MTVITRMVGSSTRFPAKSVVETSSCVDEKMKKFIFHNEDGVTRIYNNIHKTVGGWFRFCAVPVFQ